MKRTLIVALVLALGSAVSAQPLMKKYQSREGLTWFHDTGDFGFKSFEDRMDLDGDGLPELVLERWNDDGDVTGLVVMGFEKMCDENDCDLAEVLGISIDFGDLSDSGFDGTEPFPVLVGFASLACTTICPPMGANWRQAVFVQGDPVHRIVVVDLATKTSLFVFPLVASDKVGGASALRFAMLDVDGDDLDDVVVGDPESRTVQVWGAAGTGTATEEQIEASLMRLFSNFPNPFRSSTAIPYSVERPGDVALDVFDVLGRRVRTLLQGYHVPGSYTARWNGRDESGASVAAGSYFYRLRVGNRIGSKQMIRIE